MNVKTLVVAVSLALPATAGAQDWNSSPDNWDNSPQNWDNSPHNWKNSPDNWDNSPNRWGNERIVRDSDGNPIGYAVPKTDGGVNYFDFEGGRRSYTPPTD